MARPLKQGSEKRVFTIRVRCTEAEKILLKESATHEGLTVSDFMRLTAIHSTPLFRKATPERAAFIKGLGELGKIGSNVNQIARALNRQQNGDGTGAPDDLIDYTLQGIDTLTRNLINMLQHGH